MTANVLRNLFVLGFIVTVAVTPILAEVTQPLKAEETGSGAGVVQPGSTGTSGITDESIEKAGSPTSQLFDSSELASLESRAEEPAEEVAGGALTNQQLTYIVIALAAAVIVLILA